MIYKRAVLLIGLLTVFAAVSGCSQSADTTAASAGTNAMAAPPTNSPPPRRLTGRLGSPAPAITVQEWIKGKPVKIQPGTNVYVLVFCKLTQANEFALTNLALLQKTYGDKGVVTVAICDEAPEMLKDFVQIRGGEINFAVAADDPPGRTGNNYLQALGLHLLPRAFIVQDGKILWHGHPLTDGMGQIVDDITSGHFNLEAMQKKVTAREQMVQYLYLARQNDARSAKVGQIILAIRTNDAPGLCDLASQIATDPAIENDKRDAALATAALDRAAQLSNTNATDIAVTRAILLFQTGKEDAGLAIAQKALAIAKTPDEKDEVQTCIRAMEARLAALKTMSTNSPAADRGTNSTAAKH